VFFQFALPIVWVSLRTIGFKRLTHWTNIRVDRGANDAQDGAPSTAIDAARIARVCQMAANHGLYRANCLHRSIALDWCLRRRNIDSVLRIGVAFADRDFRAHAWIESDGVSLDTQSEQYAAFNTLDTRIAAQTSARHHANVAADGMQEKQNRTT
jgi:Transglutaminase-like superfamily